MNYVIIILLVLILILVSLLIVLICKLNSTSKKLLVAKEKESTNEANITERLGRFEININKEINMFKDNFADKLGKDFEKLNENIEKRLIIINDKVNDRLDQNFEKTNKTFTNILERLSKIDEAQKKIEGLSKEVVSLQSVLTDKKTRGIFGEVNLNYILSSVFGEGAKNIYELQHTMSNGSIADAILYAPEPLGTICIDSKFPLENYQRMTDKSLSVTDREMATKLFKSDVKKHIEAIATKYIIPGETTSEAILFLPAEAIFAEINAYHPELIKYSYDKKVWITSPTTLMSTLTIISMILKNMERDKYAKIIHNELNKLSVEFSHYRDRWDKLSRSIDTVTKDIKDINITTEKITKRFDSINSVDVKSLENSDK